MIMRYPIAFPVLIACGLWQGCGPGIDDSAEKEQTQDSVEGSSPVTSANGAGDGELRGRTNVLEPFASAVTLLENDSYTIKVRYRGREGLPIEAASIRFSIAPTAGADGALLSSSVAVTDRMGVASVQLMVGAETSFSVRADADGAEGTAHINVSVLKDSGGSMEVALYPASAAEPTEAEVILAQDLECGNFDEFEPPPATREGLDTSRTVAMKPGQASKVVFRGLKPDLNYAVVAIGRAGDQIIARGCRDGILLSQDLMDEKRAAIVAIDLEDRLLTPVGSELSLVTTFKHTIGLSGVAGFFRSVGESRGAAPAEYVISQLRTRSADSEPMTNVVRGLRMELEALVGAEGPMWGARLNAAAAVLASVEDVQLHSRLSLSDETPEGLVTDAIQASHRLHKLTALVESGRKKMRRDFPLLSFADPRIASLRMVFPGPPPKLEDTLTMKVEDATRVSLLPHSLNVPITDAIIGQILFDHFGDWSLEQIFRQMVRCDALPVLDESTLSRLGLPTAETWTRDQLGTFWSAVAGTGDTTAAVGPLLRNGCQQIVTELLAEAQHRANEDLSILRAGQQIVFEGSANMLLLGDGVTIGSLRNGIWSGLGGFEATREQHR